MELYSYDADGYLVAKRVMTQDMQSRDATHTYNRNGDRQGRIHHRRTSLVSGSAFGLWYDYDTHGRPWKVFASTSTTKPGTPEATYTYFASGQKKSEQYRGNLALPYSYTIRGRLETIGAPRDSAYPYPFSAHYVYTNGGNVRFADSFHRKAVPGGTVPQGYRYAYSYDGMDGLTSANYAAWTGGTSFAAASLRFSTRNISYDRSGNILRLYRYNENGTMADNLTYTYSGGTSRLAGVSDAAGAAQTWDSGTLTGFYHDSNGNLTYYYDASRGHHYDMWYDEEDRVSMYAEEHVTTGLYKETRYRYNAAGQRYWKKTDNANPEYYVMDGALTLGVIAPSGAVEWNIATASGEIVGRRTSGGQFRYYIKDHLGSVRAVVNSSGTVLETRDYYPFGLEMPGRSYLSGTKAKENYTGHERDAESGMLYAGARYYMPNVGRWTSVDPLGGKFPSYSPYNYVANNPLSYVDPDGREFLSAWDLQIAEKTKDLMQKRASFAELKQMQSNQAERMAAQDGNSTLATLASREAAEYGAIADNLRTGIGMLTELGDTRDMVFTFRMSIDGQGYVRGRQRLDGRPELSLFGSSWGQLVHEAVHAYQYLTEGSISGKMGFGLDGKLGFVNLAETIKGELSAYRIQYAFSPSSLTVNRPGSIEGIERRWLCGFPDNPYKLPC